MNRLLFITSLFVCALFINACGQYGDLYLPSEESEESKTQESQAQEVQEDELQQEKENKE